MRVDQNQFLRHNRGELAAACQWLYSAVQPYVDKAEDRLKDWSKADRLDLDDTLAEFDARNWQIWAYTGALYDPEELNRGELVRYQRLVRVGRERCFEPGKYPAGHVSATMSTLGRLVASTKHIIASRPDFAGSQDIEGYLEQVPEFLAKPSHAPGAFQCTHECREKMRTERMQEFVERYKPALMEAYRRRGAPMRYKSLYQRLWIRWYDELRRINRRTLGALFFLTESGLAKVFKLNDKEVAALLDPATADEVEAAWRRKARTYAARNKRFVEVIYQHPEDEKDEYRLLYDAGPLSTRIQVMEVSAADQRMLWGMSAKDREEKLDELEMAAEEMAVNTGATVEVEVTNPATRERKVIYEVSPDAALLLRREMTLEARRQLRSWPFAANPSKPIDEMDVLLAMYSDQQ